MSNPRYSRVPGDVESGRPPSSSPEMVESDFDDNESGNDDPLRADSPIPGMLTLTLVEVGKPQRILSLPATATVGDLKRSAFPEAVAAGSNIRLIVAGRLLEGERALASYNLSHRALVHASVTAHHGIQSAVMNDDAAAVAGGAAAGGGGGGAAAAAHPFARIVGGVGGVGGAAEESIEGRLARQQAVVEAQGDDEDGEGRRWDDAGGALEQQRRSRPSQTADFFFGFFFALFFGFISLIAMFVLPSTNRLRMGIWVGLLIKLGIELIFSDSSLQPGLSGSDANSGIGTDRTDGVPFT